MRRPSSAALTAVLVVIVTVGCGKKGPPLPPLRPLPAAPKEVTARRVGDRVQLRFVVPDANQDPSTPVSISREYFEKKRLREGDRFIHLAMGASAQAIEQAGLMASLTSEEDKERVGTLMGVGLNGLETIERMKETLLEKGPRRISPYFIPASISNLAPGQVSMRYGFKGPNYTTTSACSSGAHAIGEAFRWIQRGDLDAAVAGGAESTITGLGVGGFTAMRALSERNDEPTKALRPFDKGRDGFVPAEGAGIMVLEDLERAIARGANILCEIQRDVRGLSLFLKKARASSSRPQDYWNSAWSLQVIIEEK